MFPKMSKDLNEYLGIHAANAAAFRRELENSLTSAKDKISIVLEALQKAETTLQALTQICICVEALAIKAEKGGCAVADLTRELIDWTLKYFDTCKELEVILGNSWKAWKSAMGNIVSAGRSQEAHENILITLLQMKHQHRGDKNEINIEGVRSAMEDVGKKALDRLLETTNGAKDTLKEALKRLSDHREAWDRKEKEYRKALTAARIAISNLE